MGETPTLTIACVKWGDLYGPEYVNILYERISRHLEVPFDFVCATDDPAGLDDGIQAVPLPEGLTGWWGKMWLFSDEFAEICRDRVLFFDLDTLVIDHFDDLAGYDGDFIILRDFYRPNGYGSGLMAWKNGHLGFIWDKWNEEGRPEVEGGDQAYIERCVHDADLWQDKYPHAVVSYKVHAEQWPPEGSKIVCFHGFPRPHECKTGWVTDFWRKGGPCQPKFDNNALNVPPEDQFDNIKKNIRRDLAWLTPEEEKKKAMVIVGGAPSLRLNIGHIKNRKKRGQRIFATNGTLKYLMDRNVKPDAVVIMDAKPECVGFVENAPDDVTYYINAMAHPSVFDALAGKDVILWHSTQVDMESYIELLEAHTDKPTAILGSGNTVGLTSIYLGWQLGYRDFHLYGMDSSYEDGDHHAYRQKMNDKEAVFDVMAMGKTYQCARWMMKQAEDFQATFNLFVPKGATIQAHGSGLLPDICRFKRQAMEKTAC